MWPWGSPVCRLLVRATVGERPHSSSEGWLTTFCGRKDGKGPDAEASGPTLLMLGNGLDDKLCKFFTDFIKKQQRRYTYFSYFLSDRNDAADRRE